MDKLQLLGISQNDHMTQLMYVPVCDVRQQLVAEDHLEAQAGLGSIGSELENPPIC